MKDMTPTRTEISSYFYTSLVPKLEEEEEKRAKNQTIHEYVNNMLNNMIHQIVVQKEKENKVESNISVSRIRQPAIQSHSRMGSSSSGTETNDSISSFFSRTILMTPNEKRLKTRIHSLTSDIEKEGNQLSNRIKSYQPHNEKGDQDSTKEENMDSMLQLFAQYKMEWNQISATNIAEKSNE